MTVLLNFLTVSGAMFWVFVLVGFIYATAVRFIDWILLRKIELERKTAGRAALEDKA